LLKGFFDLFISFIPILIGIAIIILLVLKFKMHLHIKYRTFTKKGFLPHRGNFGLYCYTGAQGRGKTFSLVEYCIDNSKHIVVYSNVFNIKNVENIHYYTGFKGLIKIKEDLDSGALVIPKNKQLVIIYDEIFTELQRGDKLSKPVLDFLCQMRKRKIIFLTTAQYWSPIPIDFRRFCRYQIDCRMINLFFFGVLIKVFHDAESMKWDDSEQDFVAPIVDTTITKCRKKIANSYDTFLRVSSIEPPVVKDSSKSPEAIVSVKETTPLTTEGSTIQLS